MDAVKSAQALVHMTDEGSMQLPQPVTYKPVAQMKEDGASSWKTDEVLTKLVNDEETFFTQEDVYSYQQNLHPISIYTDGDAAKAAVMMAQQTQMIQQRNVVDVLEASGEKMDAAKQAEVFAAAIPDIQQMTQTEAAVTIATGDMQLQTEQQQMLMQQVQNNIAGQSRSVQVNNHLTPNISITFGDVRESADVDEVARRLRMSLLEEMQRCGEGVW